MLGFNLRKTPTEGFVAFNQAVSELENIHGAAPQTEKNVCLVKSVWFRGGRNTKHAVVLVAAAPGFPEGRVTVIDSHRIGAEFSRNRH
jgi:hypothetical protein